MLQLTVTTEILLREEVVADRLLPVVVVLDELANASIWELKTRE